MVHDGLLPFRDFSLAHPPLTIFLAGVVLEAVGGHVVLFDALYTAWCLCAVFPLARTVRTLTGDRQAALVAALLFLTFPEFLRWDARFFALRQASLPFLAFALEALWVRSRPALGGVLLGLFGAGLIPHALLAVILGGAATFALAWDGEALRGSPFRRRPRRHARPDLRRNAPDAGLLGVRLRLTRSGATVSRPSRHARHAWRRGSSPKSAPILVTGLAGSFLIPARAGPSRA